MDKMGVSPIRNQPPLGAPPPSAADLVPLVQYFLSVSASPFFFFCDSISRQGGTCPCSRMHAGYLITPRLHSALRALGAEMGDRIWDDHEGINAEGKYAEERGAP